ncbi:MAG TPA: DUF2892 domain-containing protein [Devosia sp.]|nr:DUF2892 domain-containing protein [Devosia sp.]
MSNLGNIDRILRAVIGIGLIIIPFMAGWPLLGLLSSVIVGVVLVATASIAFCPIYAALGLSSKRVGRRDA